MKKDSILRVCHKFLVDEDGYDLDVRDLCESTSKRYQNYVTLFLEKSRIGAYIQKNKLIRKDRTLYHPPTKSYVIPIEYHARHGNYIKDLHLAVNVKGFRDKFNSILDKVKPDIVHIHGTLAPQFLTVAKEGRKSARVIATHHIGLINQNYHNQSIRLLFSKYLIHNLMPAYCDKIICVSRHGKRSFLSKGNIVVMNPVPKPKPFRILPTKKIIKKNTLRNGFAIYPKDKVFLCPARFHEQKNQLRLAKAFVQAAGQDDNIKMIMAGPIGDENYARKIRRLIQKSSAKTRFCILPSLSNDELKSLMRKAHCVITPSINEGLGRAAMEAVQARKPVIASIDGGHTDFIINDKNGRLVNPYSVRQIKKAILESKNIRAEKGWNHQQYVGEILKLYRSLITPKKKR